jgi:fibronectin-binding autotransporter adhesin
MTREISISGRGPGAANSSAGLVSVGNNVFNGDIALGGAASEGRILATHGTTTMNGDIFLGSTGSNLFFGNGNFIANGQISGFDIAGDRFIKTGNLIGSTLWLTNADNDFRQTIRVDSGTIRVSGPDALSALGVSTSSQAFDSNGGFFEIHTDVTDFSTKSFRKRGNGGGIFADHDFGSTLLNQNVLLNDLTLDANASFQLNARNGYGLTFSPVDGVINWANGGTGAITNNGNGTLTLNADINRLTETTGRTFTITGNGTTVLNGNLLQTGTGAVSLTKGGTGVTRVLGTASTATGVTNVGSGTLKIAAMTGLPSGTLNIGNATTTAGAVTYIGAGETSSKTINLNTTTASVFINNDGSGALVLSGTINAVSGNKTLFLGGSNKDANEIASAIPAAGGTVNLNKHGAGIWVLSGANLYTGTTTVAGGTLQVKDTFSGSSRDVVVDTSDLVFNQDTRARGAGGIFEYLGADGSASAESLGSLVATAGAGTVKATAGSGGTAELTFASLGTVSAGGGLNFVTNAGGSIMVTGAADTNGIVDAHLFFNGADFASSTAGLIGAAIYAVEDAGLSLVGGNASPFHVHTTDIAAQSTATINGGIKFSDTRNFTLAAAQTLTILNGAAGTAGGILVTGGTVGTPVSVTLSGGSGITSGGAGDLVFRTDGQYDTLNLNTPITAASTGGWTKLGAGTLVLGAANAGTAGGQVHINEGTVQLVTGGRLGADSMDVRIRQDAKLDINGVSLGSDISGIASIDELLGAGILTNTGAAATIRVGNGNGSSTFTGEISGLISIAKNGSGTVRVQGPQSYSGVVTLSAGNFDVSHLANIGQASGLGTGDATDAATNAASLVFNGGALRYIGQEANNFHLDEGTPSVSIDRLFTMAGSGTISSFGSAGQNANQTRVRNDAALVFNNSAAIAFSGTGNRTLTIRGDSLGDNYMGLQLIDNPLTGILSVSKFDSGLWILGNATNSYTGVTTIGGGALRAQDGTTLPTDSNLLLSGGGGLFQSSGTFTRAPWNRCQSGPFRCH